ncbi:MAG: hypothetical protein JWM68_265 [Verrucomicrobiales bacterium]|nr:hypothetical protein [Verrucomicrobiales bacterium]
MNTPTNAAPSRNFIARFFSWLFSWRIVRRLLIAFVWVATIVVLFYAEENWRGRRAWNAFRQTLEAKGEQLELRAFIPKAVPEEQNFAATPIVKSWFVKKDAAGKPDSWADRYEKAQSSVPVKDTTERRMTDLVAWQKAFEGTGSTNEIQKQDRESRAQAAPAVLQVLNELSALTELRNASSRPIARYPIVWDMENPWGILLPHLSNIKPACRRLQLKASAELAGGDTEHAMDDIRVMLYLADSPKDEAFLVSYLVRIANFQLAVQPVWEGLLEHRWSESQLVQLQNKFQSYEFLGDLKYPLDGERAMGVMTPELIRKKGFGLLLDAGNTADAGGTRQLVEAIGVVIPTGWYYLEQCNLIRMYEMQVANAVDWQKRQVSPALLNANAKFFEGQIPLNAVLKHEFFAKFLLPALSSIPRKTAAAQTSADQAVIACALERYQLAHGKYPETLAALTPDFITQLPHDLVTGDLYKYRLNDDGSFLLYSVGWNEKDDGGTPGRTAFDTKQGDWIWGRTSAPASR